MNGILAKETHVRVAETAPHHAGMVGKINMYGTGPSSGMVVIHLGNGTYIAVSTAHVVPLLEQDDEYTYWSDEK